MLTNSGWIMMSGCGHSGIINTAKASINSQCSIYGAMVDSIYFKHPMMLLIKQLWLKAGMEKFMGLHWYLCC